MSYSFKFIVFVILALFTVIVAVYIGRYQEINSELLINAGFHNGMKQWEKNAGNGTIALDAQKTVTIHSSDSSQVVSLTQIIFRPRVSKLMKLSADIKVAVIIPGGPSEGYNARLSLIGIDSNGQRLPFDTRVIALLGSQTWKHYSRVFSLPVEVEKVMVRAELLFATGTMWIKNMSLSEVIEKPAYPSLRLISIILWTIFLVWLLCPVILECRGIFMQVIMLCAIATVLLGTLISGDMFDRIHDNGLKSYEEVSISGSSAREHSQDSKFATKGFLSNVLHHPQKIGHFILFGILGLIFALFSPRRDKTQLLLTIAMLAGATEFLQFFAEGRSPSFLDWGIDMAGAVFGILLLYLINLVRQKKQMLLIV